MNHNLLGKDMEKLVVDFGFNCPSSSTTSICDEKKALKKCVSIIFSHQKPPKTKDLQPTSSSSSSSSDDDDDDRALRLWRLLAIVVIFRNLVGKYGKTSAQPNKEILQEDVVAAVMNRKRKSCVMEDLAEQFQTKKAIIQPQTRLKIYNIFPMAMKWFLPSRIRSPKWGMALMQAEQFQVYDIFINHRGADTKRTIAGLLHDRLVSLHLHAFLDNKSLEPGENLFESISWAIRNCKIGIAIFSPRYFKSYFCLHELALLVEYNKKLIPIFWDVKPSTLLEMDQTISRFKEFKKFRAALEKAKCTVGIEFNSQKGNWADLLREATDFIVKSLSQ